MSTYLRNMDGYKHTKLKSKSFEEIQMLFDKEMKRVNSFLPMDSEVVEDSGKKAESSGKEAVKDKMYYEIIRADGSTKYYKIFSAMLDDFDKHDVLDLYRLDYTLISWRLFDSCGVHLLLMDTGIAIHMLIERKYPLIQEMLSRMLSRRLEVDHESEMAFELLRFTRSHIKK
ncbi:hypothetical protein Tco_1056654 [Tanacetum coccineum]|uniref:Uncharacterized protein n=1 Tax=Tanacetum coccineum TaxID=301880 RepID=A0ABQ5H533_9ASTR